MRRSVTLLEKFSKKPESNLEERLGYSYRSKEQFESSRELNSQRQSACIFSSEQFMNEDDHNRSTKMIVRSSSEASTGFSQPTKSKRVVESDASSIKLRKPEQ